MEKISLELNSNNLPTLLMLKDEAPFGTMSNLIASLAAAPFRPIVNIAVVREFRCEYAALSSQSELLAFMKSEKMNTRSMNQF
jgi:hypothetical protein